MNPTYIPCVTGRSHSEHKIHLCSPTKNRELVRATETTLVDCFTFGLKLNRHRINPVDHYRWYIDFAKDIQHEDGIALIAPDFDWLDKKVVLELSDIWMSNVSSNVFTVVDSYLYEQIPFEKTIGYALTARCAGPVHPKWTHSFSKFYAPINGKTDRWTYDTTCNPNLI